MQHSYTVVHHYADPRNNHEVDFSDLKKARADIKWMGEGESPQSANPMLRLTTSILKIDGRVAEIYDWPSPGVAIVDAYLDYPQGLSTTVKSTRDEFQTMFEQWVSEIRNGKDLALSATMIGGHHFWNILDTQMLYPRVIKAELLKNLSYGKDSVFVRFHVRNPPTKTGRTRGENIWFSC